MKNHPLNSAIKALKNGSLIAIVDDCIPEPITYLVGSAELATPKQIAFMASQARGIVCATVNEDRLVELGIPMMTGQTKAGSPDLTISIEARKGVTTGISAEDRAHTLNTLAKCADAKKDLVMPGHIFPIRAKNGGVLCRNTISEASVDILTISEMNPIATICQCLNETGGILESSKVPEFAKRNGLEMITISDIVNHRLKTESIIEKISEADLPTEEGTFKAIVFKSLHDDIEHFALVKGELSTLTKPVLVRVQSENKVGDLLGFGETNSRALIYGALKKINEVGAGIFVYIRHPKEGALKNQIDKLSKKPTVSTSMSMRQFGVGAQILRALGARQIILLSNSKLELRGIDAFDIEVVGQESFKLEKTKHSPQTPEQAL